MIYFILYNILVLLSVIYYHTFFADGRFVISGDRINRRQSINGRMENIGSKFRMENDNFKYRLDIYRILSLLCNTIFRVSYPRIVYI